MSVDPEPNALPASWQPGPQDGDAGRHELCLYVSGTTPLSVRAIVNIRRLCETHLAGRYSLEIIDISQHPRRVALDQIVATPTLLRRRPLPPRRFIGDLSDTRRVMEGLGIAVDRDQALPR